MSFGGPAPSLLAPSGPFDLALSSVAGSPYTLAAAIFILNIGGRFLPSEITKQQEMFLNQPWFRRLLIFVIFFVATRNFIIAGWLALITILTIGYLLNENSSICLFGKGGLDAAACKIQPTVLTPEEQDILKRLQDKAAKIQQEAAKPLEFKRSSGAETHDKYQNVLRGLWQSL